MAAVAPAANAANAGLNPGQLLQNVMQQAGLGNEAAETGRRKAEFLNHSSGSLGTVDAEAEREYFNIGGDQPGVQLPFDSHSSMWDDLAATRIDNVNHSIEFVIKSAGTLHLDHTMFEVRVGVPLVQPLNTAVNAVQITSNTYRNNVLFKNCRAMSYLDRVKIQPIGVTSPVIFDSQTRYGERWIQGLSYGVVRDSSYSAIRKELFPHGFIDDGENSTNYPHRVTKVGNKPPVVAHGTHQEVVLQYNLRSLLPWIENAPTDFYVFPTHMRITLFFTPNVRALRLLNVDAVNVAPNDVIQAADENRSFMINDEETVGNCDYSQPAFQAAIPWLATPNAYPEIQSGTVFIYNVNLPGSMQDTLPVKLTSGNPGGAYFDLTTLSYGPDAQEYLLPVGTNRTVTPVKQTDVQMPQLMFFYLFDPLIPHQSPFRDQYTADFMPYSNRCPVVAPGYWASVDSFEVQIMTTAQKGVTTINWQRVRDPTYAQMYRRYLHVAERLSSTSRKEHRNRRWLTYRQFLAAPFFVVCTNPSGLPDWNKGPGNHGTMNVTISRAAGVGNQLQLYWLNVHRETINLDRHMNFSVLATVGRYHYPQ